MYYNLKSDNRMIYKVMLSNIKLYIKDKLYTIYTI